MPTDSRQDDKLRVREAADIVRIVGEHVSLKARGREYVCLCPFHDDNNPSMTVVPHKSMFYCFVCGAGGDVFDFVMRYHSLDFREALEFLAERSGIELTPRHAHRASGEGTATSQTSRADLINSSAAAAGFFGAILRHPEHGALARQTIESRGIDSEMVEAFALGAAPDRWDGLQTTIARKNLDTVPFEELGLLKARERGGLYDGFRNRLMFPIHDQIGRVIAFGARKLNPEDEPKYLNSPDSRLFDKSATLYGLHQAARSIQRERQAVVVEGYTDVIACHQAGVTTAVATLGTALTKGHAVALRRLCDEVVLVFDGDEAGQRAADRALEVFFSEPIDVKVATLNAVTDAKDPDELLKREGGAEVFRAAIDQADDLLAFAFRSVRASLDGQGVSARARLVSEFTRRLQSLGLDGVEPVRRRLIIKSIADLAGVDWGAIVALTPPRTPGQNARSVTEASLREESDAVPSSGPLSPRDHLLGCVLVDGSLWVSLEAGQESLLAPEAYGSPSMQRVAQTVAALAARSTSPELDAVLAELEDDAHAKQAATLLYARLRRETDHDLDRLHRHWRATLHGLQRRESPPAPAQLGDTTPTGRLAALREQSQRLGGNPRALPRTGGSS